MLCKYKNIFGKVGEGVHGYRLFNIAVVDLVFTIIGAYIIYWFMPRYNFFLILAILLIAGIVLHHLFCVRTTIDRALFG
jgi:hypothetical protein